MNLESAVDGPPLRLLRVSLLFATFMAYSAFRVPVPGVNEPHYLAKARHYWRPEWCAGDFFLESADAHRFFYQTVGWLTAVCSLAQAAWIGRAAALLLLAAGWERFLSALTDTRFGPLWTAWLFLLLHAIGNLSGEWLVGGVEAKVFSYAFVFWGCGCLLRRQVYAAAALFGLAISMHPVVGIWSLFAAAFATVAAVKLNPDSELKSALQSRVLGVAAVLVLLSLPGLVPAIQMLLASDPELTRRANFIQFTHRLSHHLDPLAFPPTSYAYYGAMIAACLLLLITARLAQRRRVHITPALQWFMWMVAAAVFVAFAGWLIGWGPRPAHRMPLGHLRIALLKFYPFRLADVLVPLLLSVLLVRRGEGWRKAGTASRRWTGVMFAGCGVAFVVAVLLPGADRNPGGMDRDTEREWLDVCEWVCDHTPDDSLVYAVHESWAVKWYAQRPEYVSFKDCPQDAAGIVEWYNRLRLLRDWSHRAFADDTADTAELDELHRETGISYLISREWGQLQRRPVYCNGTFCVYALTESIDRGN
jgi:Domain of unknown function (DUF6798)